jgi:type IV pilus assembly protein PilM
MAGRVTGVDAGSHTIKVLSLKDTKRGLAVQRFAAVPAAEGAAALRGAGIPLKDAVVGLAGRDMTLRYTQVPPSPDWQLQNLMELEIQDMAGQSGGGLSADYNLLPIEDEEGGMETVLLAFARDEALERTASMVQSAGGRVQGHIPNCVALYNAFLRCGPVEEDATVAVVNIGHETTDIAIVHGVDLLFVRNLSSGGKVFDDAIVSSFNVSPRKAQDLKRDLLDLDPDSRGRYASGQAEKVTLAAGGAGSVLVSALQSSLAFCRSQTRRSDLQLDKILLCGGTARTRGLRGMLREALRCPVEPFDPWQRVDLSALPAEDAAQLEQMRSEAVVALGLAASKVDKSLYELEILPEAVKKRRNLVERGIYDIAAAVIGVVLLVATAATERQRVEAADLEFRKAARAKAQRTAVHTATQQLVDEANASRALVDYLAEHAVPLNGALLTLRGLEDMPEELWLTSLSIGLQSVQSGARSRAASKPLVTLKGAGKDVRGTDVGEAYRSFLTRFKARSHDGVVPEVVPAQDARASGETQFTWVIDYRPVTEAAPDGKNEGNR